jgi:hypothetical protein
VFRNKGDEYVDMNLKKTARNDIIVTIKIDQHSFINIDPVLSRFDLSYERKTSFYEYMYGFEEKLQIFEDDVLDIVFPGFNGSQNTTNSFSSVLVFNNAGLPYVEDDMVKRGSFFIYIRLILPVINKTDLKLKKMIKACCDNKL